MKLKTVVALLFVFVIVVFSLQNTEITDIKFLFWKISFSKIIIILGSFFIGILVGILISVKKRYIKKYKV